MVYQECRPYHNFGLLLIFVLAVVFNSCGDGEKQSQGFDTGNDSLIVALDDSTNNEVVLVENDAVQKLRDQRSLTESKKSEFTFYALDHMFVPGGGISGYYEDDNLVVLESYHGGEMGGIGASFFLENDSVYAVIQFRDMYADNGDYTWDPSQRTRAAERTSYILMPDSVYAEGTATEMTNHGLIDFEEAMFDFGLMRAELDSCYFLHQKTRKSDAH